jgi:hypothetical protein
VGDTMAFTMKSAGERSAFGNGTNEEDRQASP